VVIGQGRGTYRKGKGNPLKEKELRTKLGEEKKPPARKTASGGISLTYPEGEKGPSVLII